MAKRACQRCGSANNAAQRFCGDCGARLGTAEPTASEERRWVTVLFADISGFTSISERLDPEEVRDLASEWTTALGRVVERYGGTVDKVIGDCLMAVWGAPRAHGDDAERAVRAAIDMQALRVGSGAGNDALGLSIGVNTGEAMFGPVGPDARFTVMGDTVNTAARLQGAAQRGQTFVGEETVRASSDGVEYSDVAPIRAKGKEAPIRARQALAAVKAPRSRAEARKTTLIGRDQELRRLSETWRRLGDDGAVRTVAINGPVGVGKSRLVDELVSMATESGRCFVARCLPYGEHTPYGALSQMLEGFAGIFDSDGSEAALAKLSSAVHSLSSSHDEDTWVRQLATLAGIDTGDGTGAGDRKALHLAAARWADATARAAPALFVFEDVQWADASLLELLEHLSVRESGARALFVLVARTEGPERQPSWVEARPEVDWLRLEPLGEDATLQLITAASEREAIEPDLAQRIADGAGGNPLYVEELIAAILETDSGRNASLPGSLRSTIAARLDALDPATRALVLDASVAGDTFWPRALEAQGHDAHFVAVSLDQLRRRGLVTDSARPMFEGQPQWQFKHALIREVAYTTLPRARRRLRHEDLARFLDEAAPEARREVLALRAHHLVRAGQREAALECLRRAIDQAEAAWALPEAIDLSSEALDLLGDGDIESRHALGVQRARLRSQAGAYQEALSELEALVPALTGVARVEALIHQSHATYRLQRPAEARALAEDALASCDAVGAADLRGPAMVQLVYVTAVEGKLAETIETGEAALKAWPRGARSGDAARLSALVAVAYGWAGRFDHAHRHAERALRTSESANDAESFLGAGIAAATALVGLGRHEEALTLLERVIHTGREVELSPHYTARALAVRGGAQAELLDFDAARASAEEAVELSRRGSFSGGLFQAGIDLAWLRLRAGDVADAAERCVALRRDVERLRGWHRWLVEGRLELLDAEIHLARDALDDARTLAEGALSRALTTGRRKYVALARLTLARVLAAQGDLISAKANTDEALDVARALGHPPTLWRALATASELARKACGDAGAHDLGREVDEVLSRFEANLSPPRRARFRSAIGAEPGVRS